MESCWVVGMGSSLRIKRDMALTLASRQSELAQQLKTSIIDFVSKRCMIIDAATVRECEST